MIFVPDAPEPEVDPRVVVIPSGPARHRAQAPAGARAGAGRVRGIDRRRRLPAPELAADGARRDRGRPRDCRRRRPDANPARRLRARAAGRQGLRIAAGLRPAPLALRDVDRRTSTTRPASTWFCAGRRRSRSGLTPATAGARTRWSPTACFGGGGGSATSRARSSTTRGARSGCPTCGSSTAGRATAAPTRGRSAATRCGPPTSPPRRWLSSCSPGRCCAGGAAAVAAGALFYAAACLIAGADRSPSRWARVSGGIAATHLVYGAGFLVGLVRSSAGAALMASTATAPPPRRTRATCV